MASVNASIPHSNCPIEKALTDTPAMCREWSEPTHLANARWASTADAGVKAALTASSAVIICRRASISPISSSVANPPCHSDRTSCLAHRPQWPWDSSPSRRVLLRNGLVPQGRHRQPRRGAKGPGSETPIVRGHNHAACLCGGNMVRYFCAYPARPLSQPNVAHVFLTLGRS